MGGGGGKDVVQTNKTELSPEQKEIFGLAQPMIKEYASKPTQQYEGSGIVDYNPLEVQSQQQAVETAGQLQGGATKALEAQNLLLDPGFMLNPNQYLAPAADAVRHQGMETLEDALGTIRGGAQVAGGPYSGGSTRRGVAEGVATGKTGRAISDAVAKMYLDNYTQGLSKMQTAVQNNATVGQGALLPSQILSSVGGAQRGMEQAKLDEVINKFYTGQDLPLLQAQQLMGLVNGMPGATGVTTVKGASGGANPGMQALGLGLTVLGSMFGMPMLGALAGAGTAAAGSAGGK